MWYLWFLWTCFKFSHACNLTSLKIMFQIQLSVYIICLFLVSNLPVSISKILKQNSSHSISFTFSNQNACWNTSFIDVLWFTRLNLFHVISIKKWFLWFRKYVLISLKFWLLNICIKKLDWMYWILLDEAFSFSSSFFLFI